MADAAGLLLAEHFRQRVDAHGSDADVEDGDRSLLGLFDGVRDVGPRTALVALVGDEAVADDDQQPTLGRLVEQAFGEVPDRRAEPGATAGPQALRARVDEVSVVRVQGRLTSTRCRVLPENTKMPCRSFASVIARDRASAQASSMRKALPPLELSDEPSSSRAVLTSRELGSSSRKIRVRRLRR